jgi:hypothetical protein
MHIRPESLMFTAWLSIADFLKPCLANANPPLHTMNTPPTNLPKVTDAPSEEEFLEFTEKHNGFIRECLYDIFAHILTITPKVYVMMKKWSGLQLGTCMSHFDFLIAHLWQPHPSGSLLSLLKITAIGMGQSKTYVVVAMV